MPCKAAKHVSARTMKNRMCTVSQKVKANAAIAANYRNKHAKCPIIIENSSNNGSSDDDLEELIWKRKPPENRLPSFLLNATTFLGKECILCLSKFVNIHQWSFFCRVTLRCIGPWPTRVCYCWCWCWCRRGRLLNLDGFDRFRNRSANQLLRIWHRFVI